MSLADDDLKAINRVAWLLTGNHHASQAMATAIEAQMIDLVSHHQRAGDGALMYWIGSARTLGKLLLTYADERQHVGKSLKIL